MRTKKIDIIVIVFALLAFAVLYISTLSYELPVALLALVLSYFSAKYFGDVVGQKAAQAYAEKEAGTLRIASLKSLINEIQRIRELSIENSKLVVGEVVHVNSAAVRMPVRVIETALVSKDSALLYKLEESQGSQELFRLLQKYLTAAYAINALIDVRLAAIVSHGTGVEQRKAPTKEIKEKSDELPRVLGDVGEILMQELEIALKE